MTRSFADYMAKISYKSCENFSSLYIKQGIVQLIDDNGSLIDFVGEHRYMLLKEGCTLILYDRTYIEFFNRQQTNYLSCLEQQHERFLRLMQIMQSLRHNKSYTMCVDREEYICLSIKYYLDYLIKPTSKPIIWLRVNLLAAISGISREHLSRKLKHWKLRKIIFEKSSKTYLDIPKFERFLQESDRPG